MFSKGLEGKLIPFFLTFIAPFFRKKKAKFSIKGSSTGGEIHFYCWGNLIGLVGIFLTCFAVKKCPLRVCTCHLQHIHGVFVKKKNSWAPTYIHTPEKEPGEGVTIWYD